jgi:hypothetical protein
VDGVLLGAGSLWLHTTTYESIYLFIYLFLERGSFYILGYILGLSIKIWQLNFFFFFLKSGEFGGQFFSMENPVKFCRG